MPFLLKGIYLKQTAMKKIVFIFALLLLIGCKSKNAATKTSAMTEIKPTVTEVDLEQRDRITAIGKQILTTCNTSRFKPLTEKEATPDVIKNMTLSRLTKTCLKFRLKYGDFKDLKFVEAQQLKKEKLIVYRYKALYEKKIANKELRIAVNQNHQITAVKSKDWVDEYKR